jgi:RNA polymerase sigma factor (TIGR02999 family)
MLVGPPAEVQMPDDQNELTILLNQTRSGVPGAGERLEALVYKTLRRLAAARLRHERQGHTLTPTALANEAWLRFSPEVPLDDLENQRHLCAVAVKAMRRILVEHARARNADKRGGRLEQVPIELVDVTVANDRHVLALNEALESFETVNPRAAKAVELKFFFGCSHDEIAAVTGVQRRTVDRDLAFARAWIYGTIRGTAQAEPTS